MTKVILFNARPTEKRVALLEDGKLAELVVERPDNLRLVGNIYRGRVQSVLPGLQAAFIDIGMDKCAFLHASDVDPSLLLEEDDRAPIDDHRRAKRQRVPRVPIEKVLQPGQPILVQVAKEPIGTKGPKVTTQLSIAGRFLVLVPDTDFIGVSKRTNDAKTRRKLKRLISQIKPPGIGFIVRTIGLEVSEKEFVSEIHSLIDAWRKIQDRALEGRGTALLHTELGITTRVIRDLLSEEVQQVVVDSKEDLDSIRLYLEVVSPHMLQRIKLYEESTPLFDRYNIERDLELSLKRKVWLKSGGYITLDHAEALLAIDVNTGRNVGKKDLEQTLLKTNLEAAVEIGRQLRLRDIGGLIVVDFIDMVPLENRRKVEAQVRTVLEKDSSATSMTGLSKFGLMEITRKRVRPELQELYTDVCHTCNGLGWVFSPATVSARIDRWVQRAAGNKQLPKEISLAVHPAVHDYLMKENRRLIEQIETKQGVKIEVLGDESLDQDEFIAYPKGESTPIVLRN